MFEFMRHLDQNGITAAPFLQLICNGQSARMEKIAFIYEFDLCQLLQQAHKCNMIHEKQKPVRGRPL